MVPGRRQIVTGLSQLVGHLAWEKRLQILCWLLSAIIIALRMLSPRQAGSPLSPAGEDASLLNLAKLSALLPLDNPPTWWLSHDYVRSYACCVLARRWSCGILAEIPAGHSLFTHAFEHCVQNQLDLVDAEPCERPS